jgi:hypothetical protein
MVFKNAKIVKGASSLYKAKLFYEAMFFVIVFEYLPKVIIQVQTGSEYSAG